MTTPTKFISRARTFFLILLVTTFLIFSGAVYTGWTSGELQQMIGSGARFVSDLSDSVKKSAQEQPASFSSSTVNINITSTSSGTVTTRQTNQAPAPKPVRECYRYTVVHLDGSTSTRCYSAGDYNQLINLGGQLSSAKTFYQFHLDGAQKYQDEYDRTKSSVYLDAKASEQQQAQREKDKIGSITLQMQQIEQRGY